MKTKQKSDLDQIASSILEKFTKCEGAINAAQTSHREAIFLAWEIGGLLRKAKNELKGQFTKWREQSIPGLATATTSRYLALANRIPDRKDLEEQLDAGVSLTDLYREVGILPEKDVKPEEQTDKPTPSPSSGEKRGPQKFTQSLFISCLSSVVKNVKKLQKNAPVSQWTAEEREDFRKAFTKLKLIAEELDQLGPDSPRTIAEEFVQGASKRQSRRAAE